MNKKFLMALVVVGALCFAPACSKGGDDPTNPNPNPEPNPEPEPGPAKEMVVYATGGDGSQGVYWRNGESVVLKSPNSENNKWTRGKSITVVDGDVYVAGYESKTAILWKNGEPTALTDNSTELSVNDMAIVGEDIYIVGAYNNAAVCWKNGQMSEIASRGEVRSIVVVGSDVYMAGNDNGVATCWKNGVATTLCNDEWSVSEVYELCVVGDKVIAAGYYDMEAAMWTVDGGEVEQTVLTEDWSYAQGRAMAVNAAGSVYIAGNDGENPVYWLDGQMTKLADCLSFGTATGVCLYGEHVVIGGIQDNQAVVWTDGVATVLADAKTGPSIYAICVVEE